MNTLDIRIKRTRAYSGSVGGDLFARGAFVCYTLELPWLWNAHNVSCIPNGRYSAIVRYDKADHWRMQLENVPGGRGGVQIHIGNYPKDSHGCILVGTAVAPNAVLHSSAAYAQLKAAFYGAPAGAQAPIASPAQRIAITFDGIIPTPPGDFAAGRGPQFA